VVKAIKAGYRLFDCAQDYGNEKVGSFYVIADPRNAEKGFVGQSPKVL
jgi:diketogulonate reductase-like aldo/keto reductase